MQYIFVPERKIMMADIKFTSATNASKNGITFVMSGEPSPDWKAYFNAQWNKSTVLANRNLKRGFQGNELVLTGLINNPQSILDELKKIAIECNKAEDDFEAQVKNL